jgi:hypothetical protein
MAFAAKSSHALQHMVMWYDRLDVVPKYLLDFVRKQNEARFTKETKRMLQARVCLVQFWNLV